MASGMALHDVLPGSELVGMTSSVIVLVALGVENSSTVMLPRREVITTVWKPYLRL
jgi:hypothetical protein